MPGSRLPGNTTWTLALLPSRPFALSVAAPADRHEHPIWRIDLRDLLPRVVPP